MGLEHPSVKQVIEIAEEMLDENKILNIDTLYYRVFFGYNSETTLLMGIANDYKT